jgi:hypothetical protein
MLRWWISGSVILPRRYGTSLRVGEGRMEAVWFGEHRVEAVKRSLQIQREVTNNEDQQQKAKIPPTREDQVERDETMTNVLREEGMTAAHQAQKQGLGHLDRHDRPARCDLREPHLYDLGHVQYVEYLRCRIRRYPSKHDMLDAEVSVWGKVN